MLSTFKAKPSVATPFTLLFADKAKKITNYPIFGDLAARGLATHFRRLIEIASMKSGSPIVEGVDTEVLRLNDLEGQVVHGNLELLKLKEENDRLTKALAEERARATSLVEEKTGLSVHVLNR